MSSLYNALTKSSQVKGLLLNFIITLFLVSSAYAAPSSADLSVSIHGSEAGAVSVEYTVTLDSVNDTGMPIIFRIDSNGGTATSDSDYTNFDNMFVGVIPGATTGIFNVAVLEDVLFENTETVNAIITGTASSTGITINTPTASANIIDNDNAAGSIDANLTLGANGDENGPVNIQFTVTLAQTNNTGSAINFNIAQTGGTATPVVDFNAFATISVPNGSATGNLSVTVIDDNVIENLEDLQVTISSPSDPAINIVDSMETATITDSDSGAGTVNADLSVTTHGNEAGPVNVTYTVTLAKTNGTGAPITFNINPTGGTAVAGDDFTNFAGSMISVADGSATGTFDAIVLNDVIFDGTRTVQATISAASHAAININTAAATANILDNEAPNAVLSTTVNGNETGPVSIQYTVTLSLTNDTGGAVSFDIDPAVGGDATVVDDYANFAGSIITVANGSSTGTFNVAVVDDVLFENNETAFAEISNPTNASINITGATSSATIADNDNAAASINADLSVTTQGNETGPVDIVYTVTLAKTNNTGGAISFNINPTAGTATAGSDYTNFAGSTISVADGSATGTLTVPVSDDALLESTETVQATITLATDPAININTANASANITDNETATADLSVDTDGNEAGGPIDIVFRVTLSTTNNTGVPISFNIDPNAGNATPGSDFVTYAGGTISVPNGSSFGTLTVDVLDDVLLEGDEVTVAVITNPSNPAVTINNPGAGAHITSDDTANADLSVSVNGNETGPVSIEYTVTLSATNNSGSSINFNINPTGGSATTGTDYTDFTGGTISVANGSSTGTLVVTVSNDTLFENNETAQATISNPSLVAVMITTAAATATIIDNDNVALSINADLSVATQGSEAGPVHIVYSVKLAKVNNTHGNISFDIDPTLAGTAVAGTDFTDFTGGTISVADGTDTGTFMVTVLNDALFDGDRTVEAMISSATDPAIAINTAAATATITDDEAPEADISVTMDGDETGPVNITYNVALSLTNNTGGNVTLSINPTGGNSTAGGDYVDFTGGVVTIPNGSSNASFIVTVNNDALYENDESLIATISNPSHPNVTIDTAMATAMIADDDNTGITANISLTTNGDETGPVSLVYTVTISSVNNTHAPVTFTINPSGGNSTHTQDYTNFAGGTVSIPDGSATGTFNVTIVDDMRFENNETLQATISNVSDPLAITINTASATGTIIDNDNAPGSVDADIILSINAVESGSAYVGYTIVLEKTNHTHGPITFDIDPTGGTAIAGTDYFDFSTNTVSVPDGSNFGSVLIPVIDDALLESTETLIATIANATDPAININTATATGNIIDDESATANLSVTTNGNETGPVSAVYTVTIDTTNNTGAAISFNINPTGGSATAGTDYADFTGSGISIANGATTGTFTVSVVDDALIENNESLQATISSPSISEVSIGTAAATANIVDNDNAPGSINATLSVDTDGDESGPVNIVYEVTLDSLNNTGSAITFNIDPSSGTATAGSDYSDFTGAVISVPMGASSGTYTATVIDDSLFESDETVEAMITNPSDPVVNIDTATATANIFDNDNSNGAVDADLSVTTNGNEAGPVSVVYAVTLSSVNNTGSSITFNINPSGGTATVTSDYANFAGGVITVPNGSSTGTFSVSVVNDSLFENTETVQATISGASNPAIGISTASATANINDNDNASLSNDASLSVTTNGAEAGPVNIVYTVTLETMNNTGAAISFNIISTGGTATSGSDYTNFTPSTLSVPNGSITGTFSVTVTNDVVFENTETVQATISGASDPAVNIVIPSATANIVDNDNAPGTVNANLSVTTHGNEAGPVNAVYTVTLASVNNTGNTITFIISPTGGTASAGTDYTNFSGSTISILNGASTGTYTVPVNNDTLFENTETIVSTISSASDPAININTASATANITDDDNAVGSIDADLSVVTSGNEDGSANIVYKVTLETTNNTGGSINFDIDPTGGTATAGSDYTDFTGGTISVADGSSMGTVTVTVLDDALFENTETVTATISNSTDPAININTAAATANITDTDNAAGSISASFASTGDGAEDGNVDIEYTVTIDKVNNTHAPITFDIAVVGGSATSGDDYSSSLSTTVTIPDGSATGTYNVTGVVDDLLFENNESVILDITNPSDPAISIVSITATASGTIVDDDNTAGSINADLSVATNGNETGPVSLVYTVTIATTNNTHGSVTFNINPSGGTATAGSDYFNYAGSTISVADGSSTGTFTVIVNDDSLFENTETAQATISGASDPAININTPAATANITDNDNAAGSINADLSVTTDGNEAGPVDVVYTVTLANANNTGSPITFDIDPSGGSATAGSDYTNFAGGAISVANGSATGTFTVSVTDDSTSENTEEVTATISNASDPAININAASATAEITDNDGFDLFEPVYSLWNGFLNQVNIIALANKANASNMITVTMFDLDGNQLSVSNFTLAAQAEFDIIVNDLVGFAADQYGVVKIDYTQPMSIDGQSSISRVKSSTPSDFEYSILRALSNKITGNSYAFFNTFQPSLDPTDAGNVVFSFAQIANLSTSTKTFRVATLGADGSAVSTIDVVIPAGGRRDIEAGHVIPGANNIGLISITPIDGSGMLDPSTEYLAQIATYGSGAAGFDFAFSEEFRAGDVDTQFINVSRGANAQNWLAIANTDAITQVVNITVKNNAGVTLVNTNLTIPALSQQHFSANTALGLGESGIIIVTPESGKSVLANGRSYFSDASGSITSAGLEESRDIFRGVLHTTYNTFIQNMNWLRIFNVGANNAIINIEVLAASGTSLGNTNVNINAGTGTDLEVSSSLGITVPFNSYGLIRITSNDNPSIVAHILRLKPGVSGTIVDLAKPLPIR